MESKGRVQQKRYAELDSLRGIAALMVVLFHLMMGREEGKFLFNLGNTGVELFFIISGFVIFMSINKMKSSKEFIVNRFSRLYPTYWTCVTFTTLLITWVSTWDASVAPISLVRYLANMTMFQHYLAVQDIDGPYWTMIVEMMFYMAMLFLFHFKLLKYSTAIGFVLVVLTLIGHSLKHYGLVSKILYVNSVFSYIPLFYSGIIFHKLYTTRKNYAQYYAIIAFCLVSQIALYKYLDRQWIISQGEYAMMIISYFTLFVLFVHGKLKFIVSKLTLYIGKISFSLYLVHQFVAVHLLMPFLVNELHINVWVAAFLITLPIVFVIASLIAHFVEIPVSKWLKQKLNTTFVPAY
jgi:peptidoglycan/LPS O-acetylase OafA/YrhL